MEFVKTIEELNACVESIENGTGRFIGAPMTVAAVYYREYSANFEKPWNALTESISATLNVETKRLDVIDEKGVAEHAMVVTLSARRDDEGAMVIRLERADAALMHEGEYYRVCGVKPGKHLLTLFGATDNPHARYNDEEHPNYFNKLSARSLDNWCAYRQKQEEEARRVVAAVAEERAAIEHLVAESGVEARQVVDGLRLTAGPIDVEIKFGAGGVNVRYDVAWNLRTGGKDALADVLALAHRAETPKDEEQKQEEPKQEKPKRNNPAYRAFKALTTAEGTAFAGTAVTILQAVRERAEGFVTEVAARALTYGQLTDKQRWCVAYAFARLPQA